MEGFNQKTSVTYTNDQANNNTAIEKMRLKFVCNNGSIIEEVRESFLFSLRLDNQPWQEVYKQLRIKIFRKINKSVLSDITFYSEDDDHKPLDFKEELITFTSQLNEKY